MDEYNNYTQDEVRALVTAGRASDGALNGRVRQDETGLAPALTTAPAKLEAQNLALHRTRVNRIMLIKRRHERLNRFESTGPRLVTIMAVLAAVLFSLLSTGIGGAFAYYQTQQPLLNGMANHTLFQSTRIYDRKGRLLYELYNPKYGRRTYVNYNDIALISRVFYEQLLQTCKIRRLLRVVVPSPSS